MLGAVESLADFAAGAFVVGIDSVLDAAIPLWSRAQSEGLVSGSPEEARDRLFQRLLGDRGFVRALTVGQQRRLRELLSDRSLRHLLTTEILRVESFFSGIESLWTRAQLEAWNSARWIREVLSFADLILFQLATFVETALALPFHDAGEREALREPEFEAVFPFLEQRTRAEADRAEGDGEVRVRPNHQTLDKFVARSGWSGWAREAAPPLGWVCRCRQRRITFLEAAERGWLAVDFPRGIGHLDAFRALGGADAGFPRDFFVDGAATA